jgi:hypothetical protein
MSTSLDVKTGNDGIFLAKSVRKREPAKYCKRSQSSTIMASGLFSMRARGPLGDFLFEPIMRFLQRDIPLLNPVEHLIELVEKKSDLVITLFVARTE